MKSNESLVIDRQYWCNSHQRRAASLKGCAPGQGGITLPCFVVDLTGIAEIVDEENQS